MTRPPFLLPVTLLDFFISGCASIQLENAQADKMKVAVQLTQHKNQTEIDLRVTHGLWNQPVQLTAGDAYLVSKTGEITTLINSSQKGHYSYRGPLLEDLSSMNVATLGSVNFPEIKQIQLNGQETFSGQTFTKDDLLRISLQSTEAGERYLISEGKCSKHSYQTEQQIPTDAYDIELELHDIMRKINRAAKANLTGIIPVTLRIEERYKPQWQSPFIADKIAAIDTASFKVDTVGFRFRASFGLKLGDNFFFNLAKDNYEDKYCY
ncbi:MAG: hypothetical protein P8X89_00720 [Reinekea sp.]